MGFGPYGGLAAVRLLISKGVVNVDGTNMLKCEWSGLNVGPPVCLCFIPRILVIFTALFISYQVMVCFDFTFMTPPWTWGHANDS